MTGQLRDLTINRDGTQNITITIRGDWRKEYDALKECELDIQIKKHRDHRSRDANNFCWALCTMIAEAMRPSIPAVDVYRQAVRDVGEYLPVPIRDDMVANTQRLWAENGTAWFVDVIDDSKLPGYKLCHIYYGSSTYDTKTMSRLIDYLIADAENMGIKIPASKDQIDTYKRLWGEQS